jgi:hypothetical protein
MDGLFILFVLLLLASFLAIGFLVYQLLQKRSQLKKYQGIVDVEAEQKRIQKENENLAAQSEQLKLQGRQFLGAINDLRSELSALEDDYEMVEHGLYAPKYDFGTSERYKAEIKNVRDRQKQMVKDKVAVNWGVDWKVGGSEAKGRSMMNQQTRLSLLAFNGECDSLILKVKYNNVQRIRERIYKTYERINRLGKTQQFQINPDYLELKIQELHLVHEYQEKVQAEKEEQRRIREEMREEQRAQRELERAQKEAEREEERYRKALDKARKDVEKATGEKQTKLQEEIERLNKMLEEANEKKERALSRAQMTRSGHVYVISNEGSFGENVYKIGMTRRLEPMDRVKELGDASVPFPFDVHAIIYSDDAPALETALHHKFNERRLNKVNNRKEFFSVDLKDIVEVVKANHGEVEFTLKAEAAEYRKTRALIAEMKAKQREKSEKPVETAYSELFSA